MGDGVSLIVDENGGPPKAVLRQLIGRVEAIPEHHAVVQGSKVKYRFVLENRESEFQFGTWDDKPVQGPSPAQQQFDQTGRTEHPIPYEIVQKLPENPTSKDIGPMLAWLVIYDSNKSGDTPPFDWVARSGHEVEITWKYPGQHVILVRIAWFHESPTKSPRDQADTHILFTQRVSDLQTIQRQRMRVTRSKPPPHPFEEIDVLRRYIDAVEGAEARNGVPKTKEAEYRRELAKKKKYLEALEDMFEHHRGRSILLPMRASYASKNTSEQTELRICVHERWEIDGTEARTHVTLIDWTNPLDERLRGRYDGRGRSRIEAIKSAVSEWRKNCQYYHPGNVVIETPAWDVYSGGPTIPSETIEFDTPGKNFWDKLADFFKAIAMVLGMIATAITFITPIPGDEIVAGLIWTSVFTSTVASGISIGRRKRNGFANDNEDVFDALQIVGNIFSAGRVEWGRRAVLASRSFKGQFKEFMLIGDVATDYVEGFMLATTFVSDFNNILDDPTLSPSERVDKMMGFLQDKAKKSAMYTINVMSSKQKRREKTYIEPDMQARMRNPKERIDLDAPKVQKAETKQVEVKTRVQDEPARVGKPRGAKPKQPPREKRNKYNFTPARTPHQRGMREVDDFDFAQQALDTQKIILVRNSNQQMLKHVNHAAKSPKPESLKAKTLPDKPPPALKNPDNAGLASAHPDDPRLQEMLKEMKSPATGKPPMSHEEFVADLKKKGYDVKGADQDYIVVGKGAKDGYYSDYDLHGVYDLKGNNAYSEAYRDQLNQRFGKDLIQHGPHDLWPNRNKKEAGPNRGPQPPVTAYVPRGDRKVERFELDSIDEMRTFYESWGIAWDKIYPPL